MVKFYGYRKNRQWVATWRSTTGSMLSQGFDTEQEAKVFEQNLHLIAEKERALLKKRKRNQVNSQKITVNDLIAQYLASQGNPVTQKQNGYHAAHIIRAFGQRQAARLLPDDAFAFIAAQQARGVARITANRRLSVLRAALNWAVSHHIFQSIPYGSCAFPARRRNGLSHRPEPKPKPGLTPLLPMYRESLSLACIQALESAHRSFFICVGPTSSWKPAYYGCRAPKKTGNARQSAKYRSRLTFWRH